MCASQRTTCSCPISRSFGKAPSARQLPSDTVVYDGRCLGTGARLCMSIRALQLHGGLILLCMSVRALQLHGGLMLTLGLLYWKQARQAVQGR